VGEDEAGWSEEEDSRSRRNGRFSNVVKMEETSDGC